MKYTISPDRATLTLEADDTERATLRQLQAFCLEDGGHFGTHEQECNFLESLIGNSELDWTSAEETGDLTDAPLLCIRDWQQYSYAQHHYPVLERWGFEPYAVRSFLTDLMETGTAVFRNSW